MSPASGTCLGPYEIAGPLGAGGRGEVYSARDTKLGCDVALKTLPASLTHDSERLARFRREAQVLAARNHPRTDSEQGSSPGVVVRPPRRFPIGSASFLEE